MKQEQRFLWEGTWQSNGDNLVRDYASQSEADFALCGHVLRAALAAGIPRSALAATIDNDAGIGPLSIFNTSIPVALYTEVVERISHRRQQLTIVNVGFAGQMQCFSKAAIQ